MYPIEQEAYQQMEQTIKNLLVEGLYLKYQLRIYRKCLQMVKSEHDAHDLSQEVWVKVQRNILTFQTKCHTSTWLYSIAHNHCIDFLRKRNIKITKKYKYFDDFNSANLGAAHRIENNGEHESKDLLHDLILKMVKNENMNILWRKYCMGQKVKTIAEELNLSPSAVKMRIQRAKESFRKELFVEMADHNELSEHIARLYK